MIIGILCAYTEKNGSILYNIINIHPGIDRTWIFNHLSPSVVDLNFPG
jgi:hypothetical protein